MKLTLIASAATSLAILATARAADAPKELTNSFGMKFARIEPGSFAIGQAGAVGGLKREAAPGEV